MLLARNIKNLNSFNRFFETANSWFLHETIEDRTETVRALSFAGYVLGVEKQIEPFDDSTRLKVAFSLNDEHRKHGITWSTMMRHGGGAEMGVVQSLLEEFSLGSMTDCFNNIINEGHPLIGHGKIVQFLRQIAVLVADVYLAHRCPVYGVKSDYEAIPDDIEKPWQTSNYDFEWKSYGRTHGWTAWTASGTGYGSHALAEKMIVGLVCHGGPKMFSEPSVYFDHCEHGGRVYLGPMTSWRDVLTFRLRCAVESLSYRDETLIIRGGLGALHRAPLAARALLERYNRQIRFAIRNDEPYNVGSKFKQFPGLDTYRAKMDRYRLVRVSLEQRSRFAYAEGDSKIDYVIEGISVLDKHADEIPAILRCLMCSPRVAARAIPTLTKRDFPTDMFCHSFLEGEDTRRNISSEFESVEGNSSSYNRARKIQLKNETEFMKGRCAIQTFDGQYIGMIGSRIYSRNAVWEMVQQHNEMERNKAKQEARNEAE